MAIHSVRRSVRPAVFALVVATILVPSLRAQAFEQQLKFPPEGTPSQLAGSALAADGDVVVAGAPGDDTLAGNLGSAFVFRINPKSGKWKFETTLRPSDLQVDYFFGSSVAIDGDRIAVGATGNSFGPTAAVYVFRFDPTTQLWSEEAKLTWSARKPGDLFGLAVALSDGWLIAGAPYASVAPRGTEGVAVVFRDHGAPIGWLEEQTLIDPDGVDVDEHGFAVAIAGATASAPATALVGSPRSTESGTWSAGSIGVWTESGGTWTQTQEIVASSGVISRFGEAIDLQGEHAAIGAPWEIPAGYTDHFGAVYVLERRGSTWSEESRLDSPVPVSAEYFGLDVAIAPDGATLLAGAPCVAPGKAWLFRRGRNGFVVDQQLGASDHAQGGFGWQAALVDTQMIISNQDHDTTPGSNWGALYFYDEAEITLEFDPESPAAGAPLEIACHRGDPGDPVLLVVEELNGSALFQPLLLTSFAMDHALALTVSAPDPLLGVRIGARAWKVSPTGPLVTSSLAYVDV